MHVRGTEKRELPPLENIDIYLVLQAADATQKSKKEKQGVSKNKIKIKKKMLQVSFLCRVFRKCWDRFLRNYLDHKVKENITIPSLEIFKDTLDSLVIF